MYPLPNQEARTVAKKLVEEFFLHVSPPKQIHSDQSQQFQSRIMVEVCNLLGVNKTRTSPYHHQSDGLIERFNQTLLAMLTTVIDNDPDDWEDHLKPLCMAYNSSVHPTTGYNPLFLMFRRQVWMLMDVMYGQPYECHMPQEHVQQLRACLETAYSFVMLVTNGTPTGQIEGILQYGKPYDDGDLVWLCSPVVHKDIGRKLYLSWTGPYKIVGRISEVTYSIQHVSCRKCWIVGHFDRLKPCHSDIRHQLPDMRFIFISFFTSSFKDRVNTTLVSPEDPPAPSLSSHCLRRIHRKPDYYSLGFCSFADSGRFLVKGGSKCIRLVNWLLYMYVILTDSDYVITVLCLNLC